MFNGVNKSTLYVQTSSKNVVVKVTGVGGFVEAIDWDFKLFVTRTKLSDGRYMATMAVTGGHDDFPWYEAYINGRRVYTYVTPFKSSPLKGIIHGLGGSLVPMRACTHSVLCSC